MKKVIFTAIMFLCLGFSLVFAQSFEYTGFVKTVIDPEGYAIINDMTYQPGEVIYGTDYKLVKIEYDFVVLENIKDKTIIRVGFKHGDKVLNNT